MELQKNNFEELSQKDLLAIVTDPRKPKNWSDSAWVWLPVVVVAVILNEVTEHKFYWSYWISVVAWGVWVETWRINQKFSVLVELLRKSKVIEEDCQAAKAP